MDLKEGKFDFGTLTSVSYFEGVGLVLTDSSGQDINIVINGDINKVEIIHNDYTVDEVADFSAYGSDVLEVKSDSDKITVSYKDGSKIVATSSRDYMEYHKFTPVKHSNLLYEK